MKGNKALKTILTQCVKSAKTVKRSYFSAQYQRIAARRGKNRATLAVAHSMLIAIYHILKNKTAFRDIGSDYYDCSYLFSVRWPWIVGVVIGVLGFLGNIMEKNDKGKIKENEQAAALIAAYRQRGYKL